MTAAESTLRVLNRRRVLVALGAALTTGCTTSQGRSKTFDLGQYNVEILGQSGEDVFDEQDIQIVERYEDTHYLRFALPTGHSIRGLNLDYKRKGMEHVPLDIEDEYVWLRPDPSTEHWFEFVDAQGSMITAVHLGFERVDDDR